MMRSQLIGLVTGIVFGFLLQKGRVLRFEKQLGALLLTDMTIVKFMLSSILIGTIGLHLLHDFEVIVFSHKPLNVGGLVIGGILFGVGWAIMGYCPGTSVGAVGEGRWLALFAILGMIIGAAVFAELYPLLEQTVLAWQDFGRLDLPSLLGVNHWLIIAILWAIVVSVFVGFEKMRI